MLLCNDLDLAQHEPALLQLCAVVATKVFQATVSVTGNTLSLAAGALASPPARPGMLFYFPDSKTTAVLISSPSGTTHNVCLVVPTLLAADLPTTPDDYGPPGPFSNVSAQLFTFPQVRAASEAVLSRLNLNGLPDDTSFDAAPLRQAATYLALAMIFRSMAAHDRTPVTNSAGYSVYFNDHWAPLADAYDRKFDREISHIKLPLTTDNRTRTEDVSSLIPKRL